MKKAINNGLVKIDDRVASTGDYIIGGERIELFDDDSMVRPLIDIQLTVLFEDEHLSIIHKPAGIEVSGNKKWTVEHALPVSLSSSSELDTLKYPKPIHRLDYPTSGVLLIGKTRSSLVALNKLFENREITKVYHAVTIGEMKQCGIIDFPIDGKPSVSAFQVLSSMASNKYAGLNLLELKPETGRRHQLRKHLAGNGNPILGDRDYGIEGGIMNRNGLFLHATSLRFKHPITENEVFVESKLPKKFRRLFPIS
jgi:23S rRNA pseudouridine1911/1915/1917 synthase